MNEKLKLLELLKQVSESRIIGSKQGSK